MATSGTVGFRPDVEEILTEAFERCGLDPQTMTGDMMARQRTHFQQALSTLWMP
jgi:hypothetical protein